MYSRIVLAAVAFSLVACSKTEPYTGEKISQTTTASGATITQAESRSILPSGGLAGTEMVSTEVTAKVAAVNAKTRDLSLTTKDGRTIAVKVGPEVRNLPQVKVGDTVRMAYVESVDFQVRQPTAEELANSNKAAAIAARAPKGEKPFGLLAAGGTKVFTIASLDTEKSLVTLSDGQQFFTVKAKYPQNLKLVKSGDSVVVTVAEMIAADIKPVS